MKQSFIRTLCSFAACFRITRNADAPHERVAYRLESAATDTEEERILENHDACGALTSAAAAALPPAPPSSSSRKKRPLLTSLLKPFSFIIIPFIDQ